MAGILFISGGDAFARDVFRDEQRAYWSTALPLVLEKHGYLALVSGGPEALADPDIWNRYDAVIVARLPGSAWSEESADRAMRARAGVMVEGPLPRVLEQALGIESEPAPREGVVSVPDPRLRAAASQFGFVPSARVQAAAGSPVDRRRELDWRSIDGIPISEEQAQAWAAPGWDASKLRVSGAVETLAEWSGGPLERWPALVRRDGLFAWSFGVFAFLAQRHTSEPFDSGEHRSASRSIGLETLLLSVVDEMHAHAGATRARVLPWPVGTQWVQCIRHDFDREIPARWVDEVLERHRRARTSATWYWRHRHARTSAFRHVTRAGERHEIALHTERIWTGDSERRAVEAALGRAVRGTSAHGDPNCFRFQGAPNVLWAEQQGMAYTELLEQAHFHPHRFASLSQDGIVRPLDVICLPHHESLDRSTRGGDVDTERLLAAVPLWASAGGFLQVMNHPDQNTDELFALLDRMPHSGRRDWTAGQAVDWWSRTHVAGEFVLQPLGGRRFRTYCRRGAVGVVVELRDPDGRCERRVLSVEPDRTLEVAEGRLERDVASDLLGAMPPRISPGLAAMVADGRRARRSADWEEASARFAEVAREYMREHGQDANEGSVQATVQTNSELVPQRAEALVAMLSGLTTVTSIAGLRVLDLGGGMGALATYLTLRHRPAQLLSIDTRSDYVSQANAIARELGIDDVRFAVADMEDLDGIEGGAFDLVLSNNSLLYLPTREQQLESLRSALRVLKPGGHVFVFQANRWRWREPFTGDPLVHLLRPRVAGAVSRATGWRHNHGRVRYVSPREMRRNLRRAGFRRVELGAYRATGVRRGAGAALDRFYASAGRRP